MAFSDNLRAFPDVQSILDEALARGGVRYSLLSDKAAFRWRSQAYHFRKLFQREAKKIAGTNLTVPTKYDAIYITLEGNVCVIQVRQELVQPGDLRTLDNLPITELTKRYEEPKPAEYDSLVEIAQGIKDKLVGDSDD